ncbi:MAG: hypothetical protein JF597_18825 [Streptomyces sp.]|uniref:hypothetical protein n=1 Tax=Streptomyces sp. TaxID=1931 RepID=UPI0025EA8767|nr:hypothetical protein [Streptomyces sp.]MBW8795569.1 hypothetical protein [Streptomyces sp.]
MRAIRVASAALLGLGALALCAPVILASDSGGGRRDGGTPFGFRVTPTTVAAGGRVSLHLDRGSGCRGAATVTSGLFDTVRIPSEQDSVTATVDRTARSQASYRVTINCDGSSASTELAIASSTPAGHGDGHPDGNGAGDGRTDARTDARGENDSDAGSGSGSGTNTSNKTGNTGSNTGTRADSAAADGADSGGSGGRQALNPQPLPPGRGVQAGEGGTIGGFDLKEIGLGAALVVGSVGSAYRRSRRHAGEDGA